MAKIGTLVIRRDHFRSQKALIAGAIGGADFETFSANDTDEGRLPKLVLHDGAVLFEPNAVAYRLADETLRGRDVDEKTEVLEWLNLAEQELLPPVCSWVFPLLGITSAQADVVGKAKRDSLALLMMIDRHLLYRTFLVGHRVTLADVSVFCNLLFLYKHTLSPSLRRPFVCLNRWFKTLQSHPAFRKEIGEFLWCEEELKLRDNEKSKKEKTKPSPVASSNSKGTTTTTTTFLNSDDLLARFQSLRMEFVTIRHPEVFTVEAMMPHLASLPVPGRVGKNLFLKDKKKRLYLLTATHDREVRLDAVARAVAAPGGLRLADESVLEATLGVKQGCVTPFALVNDAGGAVTLLLDAALAPGGADEEDRFPFVYFHPLRNDATTGISKVDLARFLEEIGHSPVVLDLEEKR